MHSPATRQFSGLPIGEPFVFDLLENNPNVDVSLHVPEHVVFSSVNGNSPSRIVCPEHIAGHATLLGGVTWHCPSAKETPSRCRRTRSGDYRDRRVRLE